MNVRRIANHFVFFKTVIGLSENTKRGTFIILSEHILREKIEEVEYILLIR